MVILTERKHKVREDSHEKISWEDAVSMLPTLKRYTVAAVFIDDGIQISFTSKAPIQCSSSTIFFRDRTVSTELNYIYKSGIKDIYKIQDAAHGVGLRIYTKQGGSIWITSLK
jgi:hypothetical protein